MQKLLLTLALSFFTWALLPQALLAEQDPRDVRHEMMEGVKDAAGVIGRMMKGEAEFDAAAVMDSLVVFHEVSLEFGDLFPEGSQEGSDALPAVWTDRAGFNAALADWEQAINVAIAANPQSLDETKKAAGPVFKQCKECHKVYRADD